MGGRFLGRVTLQFENGLKLVAPQILMPDQGAATIPWCDASTASQTCGLLHNDAVIAIHIVLFLPARAYATLLGQQSRTSRAGRVLSQVWLVSLVWLVWLVSLRGGDFIRG